MELSEDTRIIDLKVGELQRIIADEVAKFQIQGNHSSDGDGWCRGLQEFADFIGCSLCTANHIKSSGVIDEAVVQFGRIVLINKSKALELINNRNQKKYKK